MSNSLHKSKKKKLPPEPYTFYSEILDLQKCKMVFLGKGSRFLVASISQMNLPLISNLESMNILEQGNNSNSQLDSHSCSTEWKTCVHLLCKRLDASGNDC